MDLHKKVVQFYVKDQGFQVWWYNRLPHFAWSVDMNKPKGRVVLSRNAMEEILRLATLNVYGVTGLAPVTFAERFTRALTLSSSPKGVDVQVRKDGVIEATAHVRLQYGLRVSEVAQTISHQVRYVFCSMTGIPEDRVELNVVVWSIRVEREDQ
jgi:uncharacterized alkaline shock family protein YloU